MTLAVLLHDVDDCKLFGKESADNLVNANRILDTHNVTPATKETVLLLFARWATTGISKVFDQRRSKV